MFVSIFIFVKRGRLKTSKAGFAKTSEAGFAKTSEAGFIKTDSDFRRPFGIIVWTKLRQRRQTLRRRRNLFAS
ncbi:hypothetical protein A6J88_14110 [Neisseria mucosa]|uniref:Uncharacterized protein n=1 Tax=Neisseria mucosa TaxID=488 RepID=A0ABM6T4A8_NEIMU|nr:hypothetical protein A6J88_14110 [Neisseria mucosa]